MMMAVKTADAGGENIAQLLVDDLLHKAQI